MNLPIEYLKEMKALLGDEAQAFIDSYKDKRTFGLRVNRLKIEVDDFLAQFPYQLEPIPWCKDGFYYHGEDEVSKHPYYYAGLFYIQEPSAMAPVELLAIKKNDHVFDFCSAPGGKTVQIASHLQNTGLIVSNDINFNRLKAVIKNVEKYGIRNAVIINNAETEIQGKFKEQFNKVLIDAPCSGEGMFRKDDKMIQSYLNDDLERYPKIQKSILNQVSNILAPGGSCVYSTCTFNKRENEDQMNSFISAFPEMVLNDMKRLMPHQIKGEGHFLAKALKSGNNNLLEAVEKNTEAPESFKIFEKEVLATEIKGYFRVYKDKLYLSAMDENELSGLNVLRNGWYLGELKKNRFEPSQSLAMGLKASDVVNRINFKSTDIDVIRYLKGETIHCEGQEGYNLVTVDHYPLGWAKWNRGILKNKYPAAWRLMR